MRISFLIHHAYGIGGTIRTTFNLANGLVERHKVEIVSVFRYRTEHQLFLDPRVRLRFLVDLRKKSASYEGNHPLTKRPSKVFPREDGRYPQYSELTDERLGADLRALDADIVIGTRPGLNVHIARQAPRRLVRIGQEHLTLNTHPTRLVLRVRRVYPRLDAITTTTEADAASYRRRLWLPGVRIQAMPNSVPPPGIAPSTLDAKHVVAVGRLAPVKRYGDLILAFAKVRAERPDWGLRLYGGGPEKEKLLRLVSQLDLDDAMTLMGSVTPVEPEMAKGSMLVVSSSMESFGMTIVEAMRVGLPVVSTDCPLGPGEIIEHGVDGLLVAPRDPHALAGAMLELINDDERRKRMGRAALKKGSRYDTARIVAMYEAVFQELLDRRAGTRGRLRGLGHRTAAYGVGTWYRSKDLAKGVVRRALCPRPTEGPGREQNLPEATG
ncbi:glycosyltransferase family 4 protein [Streptomyces natalensis]|uniref:glycosyltransferase family 4 protein n=1 Tax=Streptomyces natalensis TaxID=68242 RepID=UPI0005CA410A|nr:glycosyltransferase family 4 protein [Streptomyces natalensis]